MKAGETTVAYHDCDFAFVSAKLRDVVLDPLECELLVQKANISAFRRNVLRDREPEDVGAVVEADHDDVLVLRHRRAVIFRKGAGPKFKCPGGHNVVGQYF